MILDTLEPWIGEASILLSSCRHGNTSTLSTALIHKHLKAGRHVTILHHPGDCCRQHFTALLAKCGVNVPEVVSRSQLKFVQLDCPLDSAPDLVRTGGMLSEADVVFVMGVHVLGGIGCSSQDVLLFTQRLLRNDQIVVATTRVSEETAQLNTLLGVLLGQVTCLDTLDGGASKEVDGHVTCKSVGVDKRALYKSSERGVRVFPLGTAPGTV